MAKYGIVIDINRCNGCYNCFIACRDEYWENDYPPYSLAQPVNGHFWMRLIERERGQYPKVKVAYIPITCMHCEDAACIKAAKNGAVYRRQDGIVIIDPQKAKGQKNLVSACPYRVIYWNEEKEVPQKCTLCAHLIDANWKEPRCVEVCPTGALAFGDLDDPDSGVARLLAEGKTEILHPEYNLKEKVSYIGLPKTFVAGTVVFGDTDLCGENVDVVLTGQGKQQMTRTNNYGDFEFEGLPYGVEYHVRIQHAGYEPIELTAETKTDVYLGEIVLIRK